MIRTVRILTLSAAVIFLIVSIFYINPDRELARARHAYRSGDLDQTLRLARRVSFASSDENIKTEAYYLQAKASAKMDRLDIAKKYLDRLLELDPQNIRALLYRGELEYLLGDSQQAIYDLNNGLNGSLDFLPKSRQAYFYAQRGLAHLTLQQTKKAEKDASIALQLDPVLPEAWDLMSRVLEARGDIKGALEACEKAYNLSIARDKLSFLTPKGRNLSDRLVKLRAQYLLESK